MMDIISTILLLGTTCLFEGAIGRPKDPEFCDRGFQISGKYHECWEVATHANPYGQLYEQHKMYTGKLVEEYAKHMCSVVKPVALKCLGKEVAVCSNSEKLMQIADESGGACTGNDLNPFFKMHILDHLVPIPGNSSCFEIADMSYECYVAAGDVIMNSGVSTVDISHFHKVADKFFNHIWTCLVDVFKSNTKQCEHWQIPMLLSLQKTAMPSLFGMRLNNYQIEKLGLNTGLIPGNTTKPNPNNSTEGDNNKVYVVVKVLSSKPKAEEGEVVLEVKAPAGSKPEIAVAGEKPGDKDVKNYVDELVAEEKKLSLKEIRQLRREQRRKNKEITNYLNRIRDSEIRRERQKAKERRLGQKSKNNRNTKPVDPNDRMIDDGKSA